MFCAILFMFSYVSYSSYHFSVVFHTMYEYWRRFMYFRWTWFSVKGNLICFMCSEAISVMCFFFVSGVLCSVVFCCVLLCSVVFCCVLLCSVAFCCVLLCSVVFCCVLLFSVYFLPFIPSYHLPFIFAVIVCFLFFLACRCHSLQLLTIVIFTCVVMYWW